MTSNEGAGMIDLQTEGHVAWARLSRPEKMNAMPRSFWADLVSIVERVEADPEVRVLVFAGKGRCFSVGGDIADFGNLGDAADKHRYVTEALSAFQAVRALSKPTIAAVHGHAQGGGCELTMVCDIVVADRTAKFGTPESRVGLIPGLGVVRGPDHLNNHWMKYMVLTGESIDADDARLAGLVNRVVDEGRHEEEAARLAGLIAERAPLALKVGKRLIDRDANDGYSHGIDAVAFLQGSDDFDEGVDAFREKREPRFGGE